VLLALDAEMVLGSARGERTVAAGDFWPSYRTTARRDDELLLRIRIPRADGSQVRFRKIGTRRAQAISKVVMALAWRSSGDDAPWTDVRLAMGSVAATTIRVPDVEAVLEGARPTRETADAAAAALTWPPSSRSTTCGRPPPIDGSSPAASCIGSSATKAVGDDGPVKRPGPEDVRIFATAEDFRAWLHGHHATTTELFVGYYRKGAGKTAMTYVEAVMEALAYGWIDGITYRLSDEVTATRLWRRRRPTSTTGASRSPVRPSRR
jgi:hypothetical protein